MISKQLKQVSLQVGAVTALLILTCVLDAHARTLKKVESTYNQKIAVDQKALAQVTEEVSQFLSHVHKSTYVQVTEGNIFKGIATVADVKDTIDFLAKTAKEHPSWLKSHWFYNTYFDFYRLYSDGEICSVKIGKLPRGWIGAPDNHRITKYRICKMHGSRGKTKKYFFPLYARPADEIGKSREYIRNHPEEFIRFSHKRNEILEGVLEHTKEAKPLAWVTLEGYKELVMQGSAVIDFEEETVPQMFQVVVENGKEGEDKYWFIAPYEKRKPSKKYPIKVEPVPGVSFAGNIPDIGFGKVLVMIGKNPQTLEKEMRVGVLTDTGNAFKDNLCKFDLFTGYFEDHHLFDEHCKPYPHTAEMYILIKKRKKSL
jgi:membrane-bound lytic murein transglycosylase